MTSLAEGPKHGYALIRDIQKFAGVTLGAGTLYECLAKLERDGIIEPLPEEDRRRPYRLTALGRAVLRERLREAQKVARVGLRRLAPSTS